MSHSHCSDFSFLHSNRLKKNSDKGSNWVEMVWGRIWAFQNVDWEAQHMPFNRGTPANLWHVRAWTPACDAPITLMQGIPHACPCKCNKKPGSQLTHVPAPGHPFLPGQRMAEGGWHDRAWSVCVKSERATWLQTNLKMQPPSRLFLIMVDDTCHGAEILNKCWCLINIYITVCLSALSLL